MPVYNQGEDYEEDYDEPTPQAAPRRSAPEPVTEEEPVVQETPAETPIKKFNINPKMIACGVGLLVLFILVIFLASGVKAHNAKKAVERQNNAQLKEAQQLEDYYTQHPEERPTVSDDTAPAPDVPAQSTSYTNKELSALRKWGYTASEIETASRDGITAEGLVKSARKDREAAQREALEAVKDTASPAYLNLLDKTWLGGESIDMSGIDPKAVYNTTVRTENVDYDKCGAQGTQLFIKLHLDNGKSAFMMVAPSRWVTLAESGNIVVSVSEVEIGDISVITELHEISVE